MYGAGRSRITHPFATLTQEQAPGIPFDLHVLSTPPAFVLSQNQTLKFNFLKPFAFTNNCSNVFLRLFADCFLGCILLYTQMLN